jgi:MFS family permease
MQFISSRFNYLFRSTRGLILVGIGLIAIVTAIWGTLSGPLLEMGIGDIMVSVLGMRLVESEREGRIILLYHTIAMTVVAIETYMITAVIPMRKEEQARINGVITVGYITALIGGLIFAYFGRNWIFHGLFIAGQTLVFFAGVMLAAALWPWRKERSARGKEYAQTRGGIDLEQTAFFVMAVAMLGSACFGAVAGSYFGNGFESFLAEDVVRQPHKDTLQLAVIGHLHIMLTLIAVAAALLVGRWLDFKGGLHRAAMPLMIVGTIVITLGVWLVVPFEEIAHYIIYVGSVLILLAALFLVIYGWRMLIAARLAEQGIAKATLRQKVAALVHDPLKFGALWQMVYMNFVTTFVGLFMAIRLDKLIRTWEGREERIILTGHWHILSAIIATILLFYFADMSGLKGRARQWFGWLIIIASNVAFFGATLFETKRIYVSDAAQQSVVDLAMILTDAGLALVLVALALFLLWRLFDLFKAGGRWSKDMAEPDAQEVQA